MTTVNQEDSTSKWWLNWNFQYVNPDVYGSLKSGHTIQEAFYTTLQMWLPAYIEEFNRNLGGTILTVPKEYRLRPEYRNLPRDPEASILVVCDSTAGVPSRHQHETHSTWKVQVAVDVAGTTDWQETQALTYAYGAAVRLAIAQHPSLNGVAGTTLWQGEKYYEKGHASMRTLGLLLIDFNTTVMDTMDVFGGPPSPQYAATDAVTDPSLLPPSVVPIADTVVPKIERLDAPEGTQ